MSEDLKPERVERRHEAKGYSYRLVAEREADDAAWVGVCDRVTPKGFELVAIKVCESREAALDYASFEADTNAVRCARLGIDVPKPLCPYCMGETFTPMMKCVDCGNEVELEHALQTAFRYESDRRGTEAVVAEAQAMNRSTC